MAAGSLARRYAKAVLELGKAKNNADKLVSNLADLAAAMKTSEELQTVLSNPAIRRADRRRVLDGLLAKVGAETETKNLVYLLLDGERLVELPAIAREAKAMSEAASGRVAAEVVSARALNPSQLDSIKVALEKLSGKSVSLTTREDPNLLGGVVAKVGDVVYDGSLRTQLRTLRDELTK